MKTLLILFFASLAYAQQPDVVQIPNSYDLTLPAFTIPRHPVVRCTLGKVNVFIRWNNLPTATFAANGQLLSQEAPTLTPAWIKSSLVKELTTQGYCVYFSVLWTPSSINDYLATKPGGHPWTKLLPDPSLAFSPTEIALNLADEPPYVMVELSGTGTSDNLGAGGTVVRNRWVGYTPAVIPYMLLRDHNDNNLRAAVDLVAAIEWVANRIPLVKTKILFEGKELPSAPVCQLPPPPTPEEIKATDANWEKSKVAACNVSSVYFDRDGKMNKCSTRK